MPADEGVFGGERFGEGGGDLGTLLVGAAFNPEGTGHGVGEILCFGLGNGEAVGVRPLFDKKGS